MEIIVNLDVQLAKKKMKLNELSEIVRISVQDLSVLKTGKPGRSDSQPWRRSVRR